GPAPSTLSQPKKSGGPVEKPACCRFGHRLGETESPLRSAVGAEIKAGQAGGDLEFYEVHGVVGLDAKIHRKDIAKAERLHQPRGDGADLCCGRRLRAGDRDKLWLGIMARSDGTRAGFAIKRHRVGHGLEVAA